MTLSLLTGYILNTHTQLWWLGGHKHGAPSAHSLGTRFSTIIWKWSLGSKGPAVHQAVGEVLGRARFQVLGTFHVLTNQCRGLQEERLWLAEVSEAGQPLGGSWDRRNREGKTTEEKQTLSLHMIGANVDSWLQKYSKKNRILDYMEHEPPEHKNFRENTLKSYTTMWINWKVNIVKRQRNLINVI